MKRLLVAFCVFGFSASIASEISIQGLWKTQDQRAKIEIQSCSQASQEICGVIVELREPIDPETGKEKTDKFNPDERRRGRKLLGLVNLSGFKPDAAEPNHWTGGTIYSPREGKTYSCEITLTDPNTLEVRGYVGIPLFGESQIWTRTTKDEKLLPNSE
jgi:uncharacterized protein (DUF2147 family)